MPDRLYGEHYPDSFLDVSQPVRTTRVATLGDYIQQLREVSDKSDQRDESCFACKPSEPHQCPNNSILTCNCADDKFCAEQPNDNGWLKCPESGKLCSVIDCPDGCKGDKHADNDGFADNIDYIGNPYPSTKGKDAVSGWPCVVVGGFCETGTSPAERILRTTASEWDTERDTNAGQGDDGTFISTNH